MIGIHIHDALKMKNQQEELMMNQTVIYCRVDHNENSQMQKEALAMQKQMLEHYAKKRGFSIVGIYEDCGFPGHDMSRPGLARVMSDYDRGGFDRVLVWNLSRLYRGNRWSEPHWPFQICTANELENDLVALEKR